MQRTECLDDYGLNLPSLELNLILYLQGTRVSCSGSTRLVCGLAPGQRAKLGGAQALLSESGIEDKTLFRSNPLKKVHKHEALVRLLHCTGHDQPLEP